MTIARKVDSTIFQGVDVDKSKVDLDVAEGVVTLRGEVRTPDLVSELETRAARVTEVRRVENQLHLAEVPAPRRTDVPGLQSETRPPAAPPEDRAVTLDETSEDVSAPPSAPPTNNFAADERSGPAAAGSAGGAADSGDEGPASDDSAEAERPDVVEQNDDHAHHQPSDPGGLRGEV